MTAEAFKPLLSQLPKTEQRNLFDWLKTVVNEKPIKENTELRNLLIKKINRKKLKQ